MTTSTTSKHGLETTYARPHEWISRANKVVFVDDSKINTRRESLFSVQRAWRAPRQKFRWRSIPAVCQITSAAAGFAAELRRGWSNHTRGELDTVATSLIRVTWPCAPCLMMMSAKLLVHRAADLVC